MLKPCLLVTILCLSALASVAQQKEQRVLTKQDSSFLEWKKKAEVRERELDSISSKPFSKADSLQKKIEAGEKSVISAGDKVVNAADSLSPDLSKYQHKIDSVKGKLSHRIDSLTKLNLPTVKYSSLLDSLNKLGPVKSVKEAEKSLASLQTKMSQPVAKFNQSVSNINGKVNEKINVFNKEGGNIPGLNNIPGVKTPAISTSIPGATLPSTNINQTNGLNGISNPLSGANTNLPSNGLSGAENKMTGLGSTSALKLNQPKLQMPSLDINKSMSQMKAVSDKAKGYSKDFKKLKSGDFSDMEHLSKDAEQQAMKAANLKELQQGQSQINQYKSMMDKAGDQKAMEQMGKQEIQKQAVNHFKGQEQVLQSAMNKMSTYKKKYAQLASLKDTLRRPPNPMHGKPFIERIVPGMTFQIIRTGSNFTMDVNPSLAYRLSGRINLGAGWVQRIYFGTTTANQTNAVYGVRTFGEFKLGKGFAARADLEDINMVIPQPDPGAGPTDSGQRKWEMNFFAGLKKDFTVYKSIRGNVQTAYRIWGSLDATPYTDRLVVRIGFEFPMKKKSKVPSSKF